MSMSTIPSVERRLIVCVISLRMNRDKFEHSTGIQWAFNGRIRRIGKLLACVRYQEGGKIQIIHLDKKGEPERKG